MTASTARACCAALLVCFSGLAAAQPGPSPSPSPDPRQEFRASLNQIVDEAMGKIKTEQAAKIDSGVASPATVSATAPDGRVAVAFARETPEGRQWPLLILKPGPPAVVQSFYDVFRGVGISRLQWSKSGGFLAVLTQTDSLSSPGGELSVILTEPAKVRRVDTGVYQFCISADGLQLVYEKARKPDDSLGPRDLIHLDGASGKQQQVLAVEYPKVQVQALGPFEGAGRVALVLKDYSGGLARPKESTGALDLATKAFRPQ